MCSASTIAKLLEESDSECPGHQPGLFTVVSLDFIQRTASAKLVHRLYKSSFTCRSPRFRSSRPHTKSLRHTSLCWSASVILPHCLNREHRLRFSRKPSTSTTGFSKPSVKFTTASDFEKPLIRHHYPGRIRIVLTLHQDVTEKWKRSVRLCTTNKRKH